MILEAGAPFTLTGATGLNTPKGKRPEGAAEGIPAPIRSWRSIRRGSSSPSARWVWCVELEARGERVLLTLVHSRIPDRKALLSVSGGWHGHLDILAAKLSGGPVPDFWTTIARLRPEYEARLGANRYFP